MSPSLKGLELNPAVRISRVGAEPDSDFMIEAPIRGASLAMSTINAQTSPEVHGFLRAIRDGDGSGMRIDASLLEELRRIGLFLPADSLPRKVDYRFPMRAEAQQAQLRSRAELDASAAAAGRDGLSIPEAWAGLELHFEPHHPGRLWSPVRLGEADCAPDGVHQAGMACSVESFDSESARAQLERDGYAVLDDLLPGAHVTALARYFAELTEQGYLALHTHHGLRRNTAHNHPVAKFWHAQLNERISQLAGRPTKPSYSFVSRYHTGGDLYWHTDRDACEYTVTVLLDYAPLDADGRSAWALNVRGRDGKLLAIHQKIGEALIFRGRELLHGREALPEGHRSDSLLFHFVHAEYTGSLD